MLVTVYTVVKRERMIPFSGLSRFSGLFDGPSPFNRDPTVFEFISEVPLHRQVDHEDQLAENLLGQLTRLIENVLAWGCLTFSLPPPLLEGVGW